MNWNLKQVSLVMILSLVLIPVSSSNSSNMLQSDTHQQAIEVLHSLEMQHENQQNMLIHDGEEMPMNGSHMHDGISLDGCSHDGMSLGDCCSANCSAAIITDALSKIIVNPSESYISFANRLLLPSEWDTHLRPPKI